MKTKKAFIFLLFFCFAVAVFLVFSLFSKPAEAPKPEFKGPIGEPFVKGPTEQPPGSIN